VRKGPETHWRRILKTSVEVLKTTGEESLKKPLEKNPENHYRRTLKTSEEGS
jgi:hypothetical protein